MCLAIWGPRQRDPVGAGTPSIPGIAHPVKHPAARLDNGTGYNPVSSHPVGYGTWLSVLCITFTSVK